MRFKRKLSLLWLFIFISINSINAQSYVDSLYESALKELDRNNFLKSKRLAQSLVKRANSEENIKGLARGYRAYGVSLHVTGKIDSAFFALSKSVEYADSVNDSNILTLATIQLAGVTVSRGEYSQAIQMYLSLLADGHLEGEENLGMYVKKELAKVYTYVDANEKSLQYSNSVIEEIESKNAPLLLKDSQMLIEALNSKAIVFFEQGDTATKSILKRSAKYSIELEDSLRYMVVKNNLAEYYEEIENNPKQALDSYNEVISFYLKPNKPKFNLCPVLANKSSVLLETDRYEKALKTINLGIQYGREQNQYNYLSNAYNLKARILDVLGQDDSIYHYMRQSIQGLKTQFKSQLNEQNARLKAEFDFEQKAKENEKLEKQNEAQKKLIRTQKHLNIAMSVLIMVVMLASVKFFFDNRRNRRLAKKLEKSAEAISTLSAKKDQVLSIISHDLRAPISHLIYLQKEADSDKITPEMRQRLSESILDSTRNGLHMLENMLHWANGFIQNKSNTRSFNCRKTTEQLIQQIKDQANKKEITIENNIQSVEIESDEQLFAIVMRNLITNAIKYSPLSSTILLKSIKNDKNFRLLVTDNGCGIPEHVLDEIENNKSVKVDSTKGTAGESGAGIGLKLSMDFASKLGGRLFVAKTSEEGTTMAFEINVQS